MNARALALVTMLALLSVLAGCGGGSSSSAPGAPQAVNTGTGPATTPAPSNPRPTPTAVQPGAASGAITATVPKLIGQRLAAAQKQLEAAGLAFTAETTHGSRTDIAPNWVVCSTTPPGGSRVSSASGSIELLTAPDGGC